MERALTVGVACLAGLMLPASAGAQTSTWTDTAGDAGFAPDVEHVIGDWSNPATLGVAIGFAQARMYGGDSLQVFVDSDLNTATGGDGLDYRLTLSRRLDQGYDQFLSRWSGGGWQVVASPNMVWRAEGSGAAVAIARSDIGASAAGVNLLITGNRINQGTFAYTDYAPDSGRYALRPAGQPGSGPVVPAPDVTRPQLVLGLSRSVFRAARSGPAFTSARVGTRIAFRLSEAGRVRFTVQRRVRRRWPRVRGSFTARGAAGRNSIVFRGRVGGRRLRPGRYRLSARAADPAANRSPLRRRAFRVVY